MYGRRVLSHALAPQAAGFNLFDINSYQSVLGSWLLPVVAFIIFAECGLLIGFFLPGDTLLFPLGLLIATGVVHTPLWLACLVLSVSAVLGNIVGYGIGYAAGPKLFNKPDSRLFRREYVDRTNEFFDRYGSRAIFLARFVPIIRTFITAVAGVGRMPTGKYLGVSILGGIVWATGVIVAGYFLGHINFVANNVDLILVLIVVVSLLPIVIEWARHRRARKTAA